MEPCDVNCPRCKQPIGCPCVTAKGKPKGPCAARKKAVNPQAGHFRQAQLKTKREQEKAVKEAPLFAEEVLKDVRSVKENYWRTRFMVAGIHENAEPYAGFERDVRVLWLRQLAQGVIEPDMFAWLDQGQWRGDLEQYWISVLTGSRRRVAHYERTVYVGQFVCELNAGILWVYYEKTYLREAVVWPLAGWQPPFTREQLAELLAVPDPMSLPMTDAEQQAEQFLAVLQRGLS